MSETHLTRLTYYATLRASCVTVRVTVVCLSSVVVADSRVQSVRVTAHSLLFALGDAAVSRLLWLSHSARLP